MPPTQTLANSLLGPSHTLQLHPEPPHRSALHLALTDPEKGQSLVWTVSPAPHCPGKYHLSTTTPDGQPKRLDLYNDNSGDKTRVRLADPGHYSGQYWTLVPCGAPASEERKWYRLSNDWTGPGWFLDVKAATREVYMSEGESSGGGQMWMVTVPLLVPERGGMECPTRNEEDLREREEVSGRAVSMVKFVGAVAIGFVAGRLWERFW